MCRAIESLYIFGIYSDILATPGRRAAFAMVDEPFVTAGDWLAVITIAS
jgi:hypothetical protein